MHALKSLSPVVLAIMAMGPVALIVALYGLKQLKKASFAFALMRRDMQEVQKGLKALQPPAAAQGEAKHDDAPMVDPDADGILAKLKARYAKLPSFGKALVWCVGALALVVVSNKVNLLGGNSNRDAVSDDDDQAEVAKSAAKTAKTAKAPAAAPQVDVCGTCKPDLTAGGIIDSTADGNYVWANVCTGNGDCSKCKPVAACVTKNAELASAPSGCNACESR